MLAGKKRKEDVEGYHGYVVAPRASSMGTFDQRGQTCGIYALAAALKTYNITLPPETADHRNISSIPSSTSVSTSMRKDAKRLTLTFIGELFDADDVVKLSNEYGHTAEVKEPKAFFFQTIKLAIDNNRLVMIPFYPKDNGLPDPTGGPDGAHWALAIGYRDSLASKKILVTHWDYFFAFDGYECQLSNAKLKTFKEAYYFKTQTGGMNSYANLKDSLAAFNKQLLSGGQIKKACNLEEMADFINTLAPPGWKAVKIPSVNLQRYLAKKIVLI